jgi:hypothetical protein
MVLRVPPVDSSGALVDVLCREQRDMKVLSGMR